MKNLLPLTFPLLCVHSFAQITITDADMPVPGNTFIHTYATTDVSIDPELTGANYNWNFIGGLIPLYSLPDTFIDAGDLPFVYQIFFSGSDLADKGGLSFSFDQFELEDVYTVYSKSASEYTIDGYGGTLDGFPLPVAYTVPDVMYNFPLNYGDADSSDASVVFNLPGFGYFSQERHRVNEVDGWGTVTTPIGVFNTLRVKSTITDVDSIYLDTAGFGSTIILKSYEYKWLSQNGGTPVIQINAQDLNGYPAITQIIYQDTTFVIGINDVSNHSGPKFFPNPANDKIQIETSFRGPFFIYNSLGEEVASFFNTSARFMLDVSGWENGIYFIRNTQNGKSYTCSFAVCH